MIISIRTALSESTEVLQSMIKRIESIDPYAPNALEQLQHINEQFKTQYLNKVATAIQGMHTRTGMSIEKIEGYVGSAVIKNYKQSIDKMLATLTQKENAIARAPKPEAPKLTEKEIKRKVSTRKVSTDDSIDDGIDQEYEETRQYYNTEEDTTTEETQQQQSEEHTKEPEPEVAPAQEKKKFPVLKTAAAAAGLYFLLRG